MFVAAVAFGAAWLLLNPETFSWQAVGTLATLYVALLVLRATQRDTRAMDAKLDALISSNKRDSEP